MLIRGEGTHPRALNLANQTMEYSRVRFRKDRDGNVIAFEECGCEAEAETFRPCWKHRGDKQQEARLQAEALYHRVQQLRKKDQ
jgi:hypothetical protein